MIRLKSSGTELLFAYVYLVTKYKGMKRYFLGGKSLNPFWSQITLQRWDWDQRDELFA